MIISDFLLENIQYTIINKNCISKYKKKILKKINVHSNDENSGIKNNTSLEITLNCEKIFTISVFSD